MKAPISRSSAGAVSVCGKIIQKGKPAIVDATLVDAAARYLVDRGMLRIVPVSAGRVQISMA